MNMCACCNIGIEIPVAFLKLLIPSQAAPPLVGTSPAVLATPHPLRGGAPVVSSRAARGAGGFLTALRGMAGQPAMKGKHPIRTEARVATVTIDSAVNPAAPRLCECSTPVLARLHSP